jgi:hypothetical protein
MLSSGQLYYLQRLDLFVVESLSQTVSEFSFQSCQQEVKMELGYRFLPAEDHQAQGHPCLEINLYASPTGEHFDPHQLCLPVFEPSQGIQHLTLSHPADAAEYQVCIGRITLLDFVKKEVEAFSFGGQLVLQSLPGHTFCRLRSPAPIFDTGRFAEDEALLVSEYEAALAIFRARAQQEGLDFDQHVASLDPKILFIALSASIDDNLRAMPASVHNESYWALRHTLRAALRFISSEGELPAAPRMEDLLR